MFQRRACQYGDRCYKKHDKDDKPMDRVPMKSMIVRLESSPSVDEEFTLDTGTGVDVGRKGLAGSRVRCSLLSELRTGGGIVRPEASLSTYIEELDEDAEIIELGKDVPNALTVGKRCALYGYDFHWKPFAEKPTMTLPDGRQLAIEAVNFVPFFKSLASAQKQEGDAARTIKAMPIAEGDIADGACSASEPVASTHPPVEDAGVLDDDGEVVSEIAEVAENDGSAEIEGFTLVGKAEKDELENKMKI